MMQNLPAKIKWSAPEYEYHKKNPEWFWVLGIITIKMVLAAVILDNFLFGVFIVLAGFSLAVYGARKPRVIQIELGSGGIKAGNKNYDYDDLDHFWINYEPPYKKELILESKKTFSPHSTIMLGDADPELARRFLLQYAKEKRIEESLANTIAKMLKF